ncbi:MAG TPA: RsmE family RNA methyltransferase [Terriglobales bacterium]|nr:RsmE family RNA methyltransferase [Terriglobales bacterium]
MTRRRWIADEVSGDRAALVGEHAAHLARVLRARVGQEFDIAAAGRVRRGRVAAVSDTRVDFELGEDVAALPGLPLTLLLSIFRFERMEWAIEKLTELGAARLLPVIARRTDARLAQAAAKRVERWRKLAREAAEQSRQAVAPEVTAPVKLREAVNGQEGLRIFLDESEEQTTLKQALRGHTPGQPVALALGPEGGWTEEEVKLLVERGWKAASLGSRILRAETAAIAALAIVAAELDGES